MAIYTYQGLEKKYNGFAVPTAKLLLAGKPFTKYEVRTVECEIGVKEEAGLCVVTLGNVYDLKSSKFLCESELVRGTPVCVELGYIVTEPVFSGFLYEIHYRLGAGIEPEAVLVCMDVKAAMMGGGRLDLSGGRSCRETINGFFSGKNARGYGVLCKAELSAEELDQPVDRVFACADDYEFLAATARRFGLEWFVCGKKMLLRHRPESPKILIELAAWTEISVEVRLRSAGYVRTVSVLGGSDDERDGKKKQLRGKAENPMRIASDTSDAGRLLGARGLELFCASVRSDKSAEQLAKGALRERQALGSELTLTLPGLPELLPGNGIKLDKLSPALNGVWYLTDVSHQMDENGFSTTLLAWRNL